MFSHLVTAGGLLVLHPFRRELRPASIITRSESILLDVSSMRPISEVTS